MGNKFTFFGFMEHRGDILRRAIDKSGNSKALIAKKMGISRNTLYYKLNRPDLDYDFIIEAYKILKQDIAKDFPSLTKFISSASPEVGESMELNEALPIYKSKLNDCLDEVDKWKSKYIELMEKHQLLLEQLAQQRARQTG